MIMDSSNMRQALQDYPKQFMKGLKASKGIGLQGKFNRVVICGMGGSALPGDIVALCLGKDFPVIVSRDYALPGLLADDIIFIVSYSGNTEEALAAYGEAMIEGANVVGFSAGGILEEWCRRDGVPHVKFPKETPGFQPRCATGYMFSAMMNVLANSGAIKSREAEMVALGDFLEGLGAESGAMKLAGALDGRVPVIYASEQMAAVARMWKIKFNENCKMMSFCNSFPELNHNEMVGYESSLKPYHFIILKDPEDHERVRKRMDLTSRLIKERGGMVTLIDMSGPSQLFRALGAAYLGDWVSYHLAAMQGTDPAPVRIVEDFKKRLLE